MKRPASLAEVSDALKELLAEFPEVELALIFGSFAQDRARPESDLDLAVSARMPLSADRKVDIINRVSSAIDREVDLVDLAEATGTVAKEALRTGRIILKRDPLLLARVMTRLIYEEEDFQKFRAKLMRERRKKAFGVG